MIKVDVHRCQCVAQCLGVTVRAPVRQRAAIQLFRGCWKPKLHRRREPDFAETVCGRPGRPSLQVEPASLLTPPPCCPGSEGEVAADELTEALQQLQVASQPEPKPTAVKPAVRAAIDLCSSSDESGAQGPAHESSSSSTSDTGSDQESGPLQPRPGPAEARHPSSAAQPHDSDTGPLGFDLSWTAAPSSSPPESQPSSNDLTLGSHGQLRLRAAVSSKLYAHQLEGLTWLYNLKAGGILGDDMGLGKVGHVWHLHDNAHICCLCG